MSMSLLSAPPPIAPIKNTLHRWDLQVNNIILIPEDYNTCCQVLNTVQLSSNHLVAVTDVQILNATLRNLLLTNNKITHIESIFFCTYDNAKTLDLARNLLTEIEFNNVIWPSIRSIGLDNNYLNFIETDKLIALGNVVITVWGYPCHRDMELCWLSHCHYKMGMTEAFWSKCPYSWMIELCGDMICNSPEGTKEYFNQGNR